MKAFTSRLQLVSCSHGDKDSRTSKMTSQDVKLLPGDCLSIFPRLAEHRERIDCILIDPPYNTGNPRLPYRDCRSDGEWYDFIYPRLAAAYPFLSNQGCIAVDINDKQYRNGRLELISTPPPSTRPPPLLFRGRDIAAEAIPKRPNARKASLHTLIDEPRTMALEGVKEYHRIMGRYFDFPTVKPLALAEKLIRYLCPETGIVLDAFAGTGTTGHAAHNLGRQFLLIEDRVANIAAERRGSNRNA
jgi:DNA modification methylase